jgi:hypothetical protein
LSLKGNLVPLSAFTTLGVRFRYPLLHYSIVNVLAPFRGSR